MPVEYVISPSLRIKYVSITGVTHVSELREMAIRYFEDPLFDPTHRFLVDLTGLSDAKARMADVFRLGNFYRSQLKRFQGPVDVAIVAPTTTGRGISRMFAAMMVRENTMRVRIFADFEEAAAWLEVSTEALIGIPGARQQG